MYPYYDDSDYIIGIWLAGLMLIGIVFFVFAFTSGNTKHKSDFDKACAKQHGYSAKAHHDTVCIRNGKVILST